MKFGKLEMDPKHNPAVLETGTWDPQSALRLFEKAADALLDGRDLPEGTTAYPLSSGLFLVELQDGQHILVQGGGEPIVKPLAAGPKYAVYPTDADVVSKFCSIYKPMNAPKVLGATPRLGIGVRMTTQVWPGIFDAMSAGGFAANSIQNSVRELNLLNDLIEARPAAKNYACGFGTIETGYTGSTFEGLWLSGVLEALKYDKPLIYGADADHIQVKRGTDGLDRAKRILDASRYYTFYTLDEADVLDYEALSAGPAEAEEYLSKKISDQSERRSVEAYHTDPKKIGGREFRLDAAAVGRCVGKYWDALGALGELSTYINDLKGGQPFDLELSIDEHPPEVNAFDCLTSEEETLFVLREIERRGLPVTHIAPNLGQEKGFDYRGKDGIPGFEDRVRKQYNIAEEFGIMIDVHSADDLTSEPRMAIKRATGGNVHFKISPMMQLIFAEVVQEYHPDLFRRWWDDAFAYAEREAEAGSEFARKCLKEYERSADLKPSRHHSVFHHFSFAFVGRRDERGRFVVRDEFYSLSRDFKNACRERIAEYIGGLADELF